MKRIGRYAVLAAALTLIAAFPADPPDDPLYPPSASSPGVTGQWNLFGFIPPGNAVPHPSGISADLAWQTVLGKGVTVAVLDSGVDYDHEDLRQQIASNPGEIPEPENAAGIATPGVFDLNGDGEFNVDDYADDPRVSHFVNNGGPVTPTGPGRRWLSRHRRRHQRVLSVSATH